MVLKKLHNQQQRSVCYEPADGSEVGRDLTAILFFKTVWKLSGEE